MKQSIRDPVVGEAFLRVFERLLPLEAILQDPKRTTNGALPEPDEVVALTEFARHVVKTLRAQGHTAEAARRIVLSVEPFVLHANEIGPKLI